jgi:hypothetical protein
LPGFAFLLLQPNGSRHNQKINSPQRQTNRDPGLRPIKSKREAEIGVEERAEQAKETARC